MNDLQLDDFYFDFDSVIKHELKELDLSGLTGGKHLRSKLIALIGNIFKLEHSHILQLGRTVELVHNATLTHDDVVDNSHTRRGNPSIPALVNNKKSVLLGDYMLAKALHELSDFNNPKLTAELTLTLKDLVEGEWIQYENTNPYQISTHLYETLAIKKTGSLFRWCFLAPLLVSNSQANQYDLFQELGEQMGVVFQMCDDVIDFTQTSKKTYGLDFANNNINFVLHFIGKSHPELEKNFLQTETLADLKPADFKVILQAIELAKTTIDAKLKRCFQIIASLEKEPQYSETALTELKTMLAYMSARIF